MSNENKYEFKGTPAPWKPLHMQGLGQHWYSVTDDKGDETQDIYWVIGLHDSAPNFTQKHEEKMANIHLVAAAPELLQACVVLQQTLEPLVNNPVHEDLMNQLKQAIHKALNIN